MSFVCYLKIPTLIWISETWFFTDVSSSIYTNSGDDAMYVKASIACRENIKSGVCDCVEYILVEIYKG